VRGQSTDYQAELRVVGKQIVRTNVGSFPTIVTQIRLNSEKVKNVKAYFTDDPGRVPVLVTASVSKGDLRVELAGSELITPPDATPTPTPAIVIAPAPTPTPPRVLDENLPFTIGEQLNYQVFIGGGTTRLSRSVDARSTSIATVCFSPSKLTLPVQPGGSSTQPTRSILMSIRKDFCRIAP
jgi:Protein of unknown function (DUF3108)